MSVQVTSICDRTIGFSSLFLTLMLADLVLVSLSPYKTRILLQSFWTFSRISNGTCPHTFPVFSRQACSADTKVLVLVLSLSLFFLILQNEIYIYIYEEVLRNIIKCSKNENWIITFAQVFRAFILYFKALLAMIADLILHRSTCLVHSGILSHSYLQNCQFCTLHILSGYCWYTVFQVSPAIHLGSSPGSDWFTQGHSQTFSEDITSLYRLCDLGNCCVWRWTLAGIWFWFHHSIESNF